LVEDGDHTGLSFWVQVKGQKKVSRLRDGSISFKLESKDLEYHTRLPTPIFLFVVDVTKRVGYWVFTQEYERTSLRNVGWRNQDHIQIRLPPANTLSDLARLRSAVRDAIKYMTGLSFLSDIRTEKRELEVLDPRFKVEISVNDEGRRHYHFHSGEIIPVEFSYKGDPSSGKIEEMLDRGLPISVQRDEIEIAGSPLFEIMFEWAGDRGIQLQMNRTYDGHINLLRADASGAILGRIDAIPCKITCGRKEARVEAKLEHDLLAISLVIAQDGPSNGPISMPIDLSAWQGRHLMELPYFEQVACVFGNCKPGDRFNLECFIPGQRVFDGQLDTAEDRPFRGIDFLLVALRKACTVAALRRINPVLSEGYSSRSSLIEIEKLHEILVGDGHRERTPKAQVRTSVRRGGLRKFLTKVKDFSALGTLSLCDAGSFPFLGDSIAIEKLERVVTDIRLVTVVTELRDQLRRFPQKREFWLEWEATETTETILRLRKDVVDTDDSAVGMAS